MGMLRLYLAVSVFAWHVWQVDDRHMIYSFAAVYCFFIMSGFYISMALDRNYPASPSGTLRFYANRILRLYPTYLAVLVMTASAFAAGIIKIGGVPNINGPWHFWPVIWQLTVLPRVIYLNLTLNTTVDQNTFNVFLSVGLEMIFYTIAPFFVRWKTPNLILLFLASAIWHFTPWILGWPDRQWQYEFFPSLLVFFVAGALSYRLYLAIKYDIPKYVGWLLPIGIVTYGACFNQPIYTNYFEPLAIDVSMVLMMPFLFVASRGSRIDKFLGDLSYPFFVFHPLAALLAGGGIGLPTNAGLAFAIAIAGSVAIHFIVELPIDRMRSVIRKGTSEPMKIAVVEQPKAEVFNAIS